MSKEKNNCRVKEEPWDREKTLSYEDFNLIRYATRCWLLQERVPLSFLEARIYLHEEKPESLEDISEKFNVPLEDILEMEPSIREKVDAAIQQREVFFGHDPIKRQRQKSK